MNAKTCTLSVLFLEMKEHLLVQSITKSLGFPVSGFRLFPRSQTLSHSRSRKHHRWFLPTRVIFPSPTVWNNKSHICAAVVVFHELLTCIDKMVPSLRGSISPDQTRGCTNTAFTKRQSRRSYFSLGQEETKGKLNLHMDNLYQSPH